MLLERKAKRYWQLRLAWVGLSEERVPIEHTLFCLTAIKATSTDSPHLATLCTKLMDEIIWQMNATEEQLENLP